MEQKQSLKKFLFILLLRLCGSKLSWTDWTPFYDSGHEVLVNGSLIMFNYNSVETLTKFLLLFDLITFTVPLLEINRLRECEKECRKISSYFYVKQSCS